MNKEHFLTELKLALRPLTASQQQQILDKYDSLFEEGLETGETEEQIAKELGKPRVIAQDILAEFGVEAETYVSSLNGWQELPKMPTAEMPFEDPVKKAPPYEEQTPYTSPYQAYKQDSPVVHALKIMGLVCLNCLFVFWLFFTAAVVLASFWLVAVLFLFLPVIAIGLMFFQIDSLALFQLFVSMALCGGGVLGIIILCPLTKLFFTILKNYTRWNLRVLRGY